jgi:type III secretion system (T3SS) SseB-like protein
MMNFFRRRRKPPLELPVADLRFLCEQDGEPERRLKAQVASLLERHAEIERAYLVQMINGGETSVSLCLRSSLQVDDPIIVREIAKIFAGNFSSREHLDILFLNEEQEAELVTACASFYPLSGR